MNRRKATRLILAFTTLALAATVFLLAMIQANSDEPTPVAAFKSLVTLPSGISIELVGVRRHQSDDKSWWLGDGTPVEGTPYSIGDSKLAIEDGRQSCEFAVRVSAGSNSDASLSSPVWKSEPSGSSAGGALYGPDGELLKNHHVHIVELPAKAETVTLRVGIATDKTRELQWAEFKDVALKPDPLRKSVGVGWLDFRLIGVRPDFGDEIYDPRGKLIARRPDPGLEIEPWGKTRMARQFIFDLPQTDVPITLGPIMWLRESSSGRTLSSSQYPRIVEVDGARRLIVDACFDATYPGRWFGQSRVQYVDIPVRYFRGPKRRANLEFAGPFEVGTPVKCDGGDGELVPIPVHRGWSNAHVKFRLRTNSAFDRDQNSILIYGVDGRRHLVGQVTGNSGSAGAALERWCDGISLDNVAAVTAGEPLHENVFKRVFVGFPHTHDHHPHFDTMAKRLGLTGMTAEKIRNYEFKSAAEAIKVIDVVRGYHVTTACRAIENERLRPEDISEDDRKRIRVAARRWLHATIPIVRANAAAIGLWGRWNEFVEPAFEIICSDNRYRGQVVFALERYYSGNLTDEQIHAVKRILLEKDDRVVCRGLLRCIGRRRENSPAALEAFVDLLHSDKLWHWWQAANMLATWDEGRAELKILSAASQKLRRRIILAGKQYYTGATDEEVNQVRQDLPDLISPALLRVDLSLFSNVMNDFVKFTDRTTATTALVEFLSELNKEWDLSEIPGNASPNWWAVDRTARILNNWHNKNFGGVGGGDKESERSAADWKALAKEIVRWHAER